METTSTLGECVCDVFAIYDNNISPSLLMIITPLHVGDAFAEGYFNFGRQHGLPWAETQRYHSGDFLVAVPP